MAAATAGWAVLTPPKAIEAKSLSAWAAALSSESGAGNDTAETLNLRRLLALVNNSVCVATYLRLVMADAADK